MNNVQIYCQHCKQMTQVMRRYMTHEIKGYSCNKCGRWILTPKRKLISDPLKLVEFHKVEFQ